MYRKSLVLTTSAIILAAGAIPFCRAKPSIAAASRFPTTEMHWTNWEADQPWQPMRLTVPDKDTTISAEGGELRRYDVHIAKMFEVTHHLCQNKHKPNLFNWLHDDDVPVTSKLKRLDAVFKGKRTNEGFSWNYEAANGNVFMGGFYISCELAKDVVSAYGLDKNEPTVINRWYWIRNFRQEYVAEKFVSEEYLVPKLKITGTKIRKWLDFVQTLQPAFSDYYREVEVEKRVIPFPVEKALSELRWKSDVPILLPNELPWMPIGRLNQDEIKGEANPDGYSVCVSFPKVGCDRPTLRHFDSISARRISAKRREKLERPSWIGPKDIFREIELAEDIQGFFHQACGTYCTSSVQWQYRGVIYTVHARFGEQPILVKIANSMIEAGER